MCGSTAVKAAKPKPKPAPKPQPTEEVPAAQPTSYHDIVMTRVKHMREQRENRIKGLFSKAV